MNIVEAPGRLGASVSVALPSVMLLTDLRLVAYCPAKMNRQVGRDGVCDIESRYQILQWTFVSESSSC